MSYSEWSDFLGLWGSIWTRCVSLMERIEFNGFNLWQILLGLLALGILFKIISFLLHGESHG